MDWLLVPRIALNFETPTEESTLDIIFVEHQLFTVPVAAALLDIALQQAPFETATSGAEAAATGTVDKRPQKLEQSVAQLVEYFKQSIPTAAETTARPPALRRTLAHVQKLKTAPKPCPAPHAHFQADPALDPDVLRSAREQVSQRVVFSRWLPWLRRESPS